MLADLTDLFDEPPRDIKPLSGGSVAEVYRFRANNALWVAKVGAKGSALDIEGSMLRYLKSHTDLPIPEVFHSEDTLLVMEFVEHDGRGNADREAAIALSQLHEVRNDRFGFEYDTLIGSLHQPNPQTESWIEFFAEHRLKHMTKLGIESGRVEPKFADRISKFCEKLGELIDEPNQASLIHGDVWSGNVLVENGSLAALIDPAIYFAHYEIEIAFIGMFHTFGDAFYDAYTFALDREFFETRRDVYNLYPLLVHSALFGSSYVRSVDRTLRRFGC